MRTSKFREAFKENANLAGMAGALAVAAAFVTPIPLLIAAAAEAAYLLFVPDSHWYEARLSKRFDDEVIARRKALKDRVVPTLRDEVQVRFFKLESVRSQITTQSQDEQQWFREVLRKLDYLLDKFLLFAGKEAQFRHYLESLLQESTGESQDTAKGKVRWQGRTAGIGRYDLEPKHRKIELDEDAAPSEVELDEDQKRTHELIERVRESYTKELGRIRSQIEKEQDSSTKAVIEKRADVLQRRFEYVGKIGGILENLNHQLRLVEETFGLINDEIRARSPEQILADIEEVVVATESMTETLEELAPYEQMANRLAG